MTRDALVDSLIEFYKKDLDNAEIVFNNICTSGDLPFFNLGDDEIQLTVKQVKEFTSRYAEEIAPYVRDLARVRGD